MTQERVTIIEEVVVAGEVVTQQRETLRLVTEPEEEIARKEAMSVNHPDYVSAQDRVYTYNPETNMSESKRREDAPEPDEADTEAEPFFYGVFERDEDEPVTQEELDQQNENATKVATCNHPIGNGSCILEEGHAGQHRLHPVEE